MSEGKSYHTRQQAAILSCIENYEGSYITANGLMLKLQEAHVEIGLTTVYRTLEKLAAQGIVTRILVDGEPGACFQYCPQGQSEDSFYLKCERCGKMEGSDCSHLKELYDHLSADHHFRINPGKTVFYGLCTNCQKK